MRFLFFALLVFNLAIVAFAFQQPMPTHGGELAVINLPRVSNLSLLEERRDMPEALPGTEELPVTEPQVVKQDKLGLPLFTDFFKITQAPAAPEPPLKAEPISGPACLVVSGFGTRRQAQQWLAGHVEGPAATAGIQATEVPGRPLHWVLTPPLPSRSDALALLGSLQRRQIDSYLVTEGDQTNAISLGLFRTPRAARALLDELHSKGIEAVLGLFPRMRSEFFIILPGDPESVSGTLPEGVEFSIDKDACQGVALGNKSP